jgi:hypothetical protein
MRTGHVRDWRKRLNQAASVAAIVSLSVVCTLLVQRLLLPQPASADPSEVRATSFILVGPDGTEIGRLGPDSQGDGDLRLLDQNGNLRIAVSGSGDLLAYGTDSGTALAQLYANADGDKSGLILRDPDGKIRVDAGQTPDDGSAAVRVDDPDGNLRVGIGSLASDSGGNSGNFGMRVRDASGAIMTTVP